MSPPDKHELPDFGDARFERRANGYFWISKPGGREYGPFTSLADALDDLNLTTESGLELGETLAEAEDEIGIADWIDPDTGVPAEEGVPRRGAEQGAALRGRVAAMRRQGSLTSRPSRHPLARPRPSHSSTARSAARPPLRQFQTAAPRASSARCESSAHEF